MSQQHLDGFLRDVGYINADFRAEPRLGFLGRKTSLAGLLAHLQATVNDPQPMTYIPARQLCEAGDARLHKYTPAIQRLVSVWGRGAHRPYPSEFTSVAVPRYLIGRAQQAFLNRLGTIPANLQPNFNELVDV